MAAPKPNTGYHHRLHVDESTIAGAGKGLFASKPIKRGEIVAEYWGNLITEEQASAQYAAGGGTYLYRTHDGRVMDAEPVDECIAKYANDARGASFQPGLINNVRFEERAKKVLLIASRNIHPGDEILINYGRDYWRDRLPKNRPKPVRNRKMEIHHHKIQYVEFPASDMAATERFYHQAFGWKFTAWGDDYLAFSGSGLEGGFFQSPDQKASSPLIILYSADLEATQQIIENAGGKIAKPIYSFPGGRRFHFNDTTGNELAVWSDVGVPEAHP